MQSRKKNIIQTSLPKDFSQKSTIPLREQIRNILNIKNLPESFLDARRNFSLPIEFHSHFVFNHLLRHHYQDNAGETIARPLHGIQHSARTAFYIPILIDLFKRYGNHEAASLTDEKIKLLQIAALFHDAGREDDYEDRTEWEQDSAVLLYYYLTHNLQITSDIATDFVEAIINKDFEEGQQWKTLFVHLSGRIQFRSERRDHKSIFAKLLHDADCLDIIRARMHFNAYYLHFHREIASHNPLAFKEQTSLIAHVRQLIHHQGDCYLRPNIQIKKLMETQHAYEEIQNLAKHIFRERKTVTFDAKAPLTTENMQAAMDAGYLYIRAVEFPSAIRNKDKRDPEFMAALEVRKALRDLSKPTRTIKENKYKDGNEDRPTSLAGPGSITFNSAGFLIVDSTENNISHVSSINIDSGRGKASERTVKKQEAKVVKESIEKLRYTLKMGGHPDIFTNGKNSDDDVTPHNEVTRHLRGFNAIFYTEDPTFRNQGNGFPHPYSAKLQALFIQKEYASQTKGEMLPIFKYSGLDNSIRRIEQPTDEEIIGYWEKAVESVLKKAINDNETYIRMDSNETIERLKINAVYYPTLNLKLSTIKEIKSADANYPIDLQAKITERLRKLRFDLVVKPTLSNILNLNLSDQYEIKLSTCSANFFQTKHIKDPHKSYEQQTPIGLIKKTNGMQNNYIKNYIKKISA